MTVVIAPPARRAALDAHQPAEVLRLILAQPIEARLDLQEPGVYLLEAPIHPVLEASERRPDVRGPHRRRRPRRQAHSFGFGPDDDG